MMPVSTEQQIGIAIMGLGVLSESSRRFGLALQGYRPANVREPGPSRADWYADLLAKKQAAPPAEPTPAKPTGGSA